MSWRGSTTVSDRIFACLPYLLPLLDGLRFGGVLFRDFPFLAALFSPLASIASIYTGVPFLGLIVFFALFLLVVRNEKINHFIRFNAMQAILLDIVIFLFGILIEILIRIPGTGFAIETLASTIFIGVVVAVVYSVAQSIMGKYAEIPAISEAVYTQVR
ncbi:MAG: Tic20 family protein [Nostocaceae cyanobacterium]|nr:Tic20 family protein [Nostocaceae cyanobacterium]